MIKTYLNLAAYNYRRAAFYAARGNNEKCQAMLRAAFFHDKLAQEEADNV